MTSENVLFLFAHQDDEFFVLPRIRRELESGHNVYCVYTTDGGAYGASAAARLAESQAVLMPLGMKQEQIVPLGTEHSIPDGASYKLLKNLWDALNSKFSNIKWTRIYSFAWEGGHADHDAAHLLAVALQRRDPSISAFEFSGYRALGSTPLFRCLSLIPNKQTTQHDKLTVREAIAWFLSPLTYVTQRKTFMALLPFCACQILVRRSGTYRNMIQYNYDLPPHAGKLFYEARFKLPFAEFHAATEEFINNYVRKFEPAIKGSAPETAKPALAC